jgi:hypothetical protein
MVYEYFYQVLSGRSRKTGTPPGEIKEVNGIEAEFFRRYEVASGTIRAW